MSRILDWQAKAVARLQSSGSDSARLDAELLLTQVLKKNRAWLFAFADSPLSREQESELEGLLTRRERGEPMAHILGEREFWSLKLQVNPSTLIPRADTETLVEWALELPLPACAQVLDLGTGTGAIALALASEQPSWQVQGVDKSSDAVALAQANAAALHLAVRFFPSDWFAKVEGRFDLIVANPPYIDAQDPHLHQGDVRFEPRTALVAGQQGLADLAHLIDSAPLFLRDHGWLLLEHGYQQAEAVQTLLRARGFSQIATRQDLGGQPRITGGQWRVQGWA